MVRSTTYVADVDSRDLILHAFVAVHRMVAIGARVVICVEAERGLLHVGNNAITLHI